MKLLVISGGRHPYEESTPILNDFLTAAGHDVTVTEDASVLANGDEMNAFDALVFNTRRENIEGFGDWALEPAECEGMASYIKSGKGFVCIHISTCLSATWPEYHEITGGGWISGTSYHPPYGEFTVNVSQAAHPGVQGVSDFSHQRRALYGPGLWRRQRHFPERRFRGRHLALGTEPGPHVQWPAAPTPWHGPAPTATARSSSCSWATTAAASRPRSSRR